MQYLTSKEAAKQSGFATGYIRQLIAKGLLPGTEKWGRDWFIPKESLEAYLRTERKRGRKFGG